MKLKLHKPFFLLITVLLVFIGCKKEYESIEALDEKAIEEYLKQNNLSFQKHTNGIYYKILKTGTGGPIEYTEKIPVVYSVRSLDGSFIDADTIVNHYGGSGRFFGYFSPDPLRTTIKEALVNKGGEIRVLIPSYLAYGRSGRGPIPGNASLDYTVRVLDQSNIPAYDDASIQSYMQTNSLTGFTKTSEGLYYKIVEPGTGSPITVDSVLTTQYTGKLLNGKVFQATGTDPAVFTLSETIEAWKNAVTLIKGGGTIRILSPSALAYGIDGRSEFGNYIIPPFSCLDFEVKVTDVSSR